MAHRSETSHTSMEGYSQTLRMAALTCNLIGLQLTWSVEMTYFTPYLLQLGLEKSQTALVWLAPPLSGFIVQPIIGTISDTSTWKWGRRRPYMLIGSVLVAICMLTLAWAPELIRLIITNQAHAQSMTIGLAVFCIYALDFAINVVQATSRGLIVDTLPMTQQQLGSAWAGRMLGLGHLIGFFIGTLDLVSLFGTFLGGSQLKQVSFIASCLLLSSVAVTCWCVQERTMLSTEQPRESWFKVVIDIYKVASNLPRRIQAICWITFWCWIGWSPFHVYVTTWVGETYYQQNERVAKELQASLDVAGAISRKGAVSLFLFSIVSFIGSMLWPWVVKTPEVDETQPTRRFSRSCLAGSNRIWIDQPDLVTAWAISQIFFSASMILAPFSKSYASAIAIVALCGIPWAMYGWAPLALLGEEINKLEGVNKDQSYSSLRQEEEVSEVYQSTMLQASLAHTMPAQQAELTTLDSCGPSAGVYLGIWNMFATVPQFLATLIAMVAFAIFEPGKSLASGEADIEVPPRTSGIAFCLAIGAVSSLVAAILTFRMRKL